MTTTAGYGTGSTVTPEAVLLDFELAGIGSRSVAYSIDIVIQVVALLLYLIVVGFASAASEVAGLIFLLVGLVLIVLGYPVLFETINGGQTLGRKVVGTRVVTVEGAPVRFRQSVIRSLLGIVDLLLSAGAIAVVTALVTRKGQRLGDLVAGTMVIRDRATHGPTGAVYFWAPGHLVVWSQAIDPRGLGNDGYQLVRDYLTRHDLAEPAKTELGDELAAFVGHRLPHAQRPAGVSPVDYLTAVAAAAQNASTGGPVPTAPPPPSPNAAITGFMPPPPPPGFGQSAGNLPPAPPPGFSTSVQAPPPPGQMVRSSVQPPPPPGYGAPSAMAPSTMQPPPPSPPPGYGAPSTMQPPPPSPPPAVAASPVPRAAEPVTSESGFAPPG